VSNTILLVAGPPGAGKSTVAGLVADGFERSVHVHTDHFYDWIARGYVESWRPESLGQNLVIADAIAAAADRLATGGYDVVVDGVLGLWALGPWHALERPISYVLLLPDAAVARQRAAERGEHPLKDLEVVGQMHAAFVAHLEGFEHHVIDSTDLSPEATATEVRRRLDAGDLRLR
jgi:cytidylate kinase